ncbi:MAG: ABC transporter ATP-binding protein [Betaproteobacteria bacterium]|nr:ABC transporter ATP-binding protein [Betaproteobacteria bacterium]
MLEARALTLEVPGRVLCRDLAFAVKPGECWGILGNNGSGKTTLVQALGGLRTPASGGVSLEGRSIEDFGRRELARRMGVLLQEEAHGFWGNVMEYVLLGRHPHARTVFGWMPEDKEAALAALERLDLAGIAYRSLNTLSGGERQRVRIAQLLAQAPEFLLLDEPLQHLDLRHQLEAMELLRELAAGEGKALVMVLHETLWAGHYCDHLVLLHDGGRAVSGPAADLFTHASLEALYGCALAEVGGGGLRHFVPTPERRVYSG